MLMVMVMVMCADGDGDDADNIPSFFFSLSTKTKNQKVHNEKRENNIDRNTAFYVRYKYGTSTVRTQHWRAGWIETTDKKIIIE